MKKNRLNDLAPNPFKVLVFCNVANLSFHLLDQLIFYKGTRRKLDWRIWAALRDKEVGALKVHHLDWIR